MFSTDKVIEIFCLIDEFSKEFEYFIQKSLIGVKSKRPSTMSSSEIMTITVLFHTGCFKNFKHFYTGYVQKHMQKEFPNTVSYNRFIKLMQTITYYDYASQVMVESNTNSCKQMAYSSIL